MNPDHWKRVDELLEAALDLQPELRQSFLQDHCGEDETLRKEIESLLKSHEEARSFISNPALELASEFANHSHPSIPSGTMFGPYQIRSFLGAGGMGEVYVATDSRLDRDVALKVLPHDLVTSEDRKLRFQQESRAAGAFNHPNVVSVYDVGSEGDIPYIVSELVSGESLKSVIRRGPLTIPKVLEIGSQIADALEAAHAEGIVHCDIKPANIMINSRGQAKVLDFGLARLKKVSDSNPKLLFGTAAYMSPEQASGQAIDHRSDLFSLGSVLYEMITSEQPFPGPSPVEIIERVIHTEPKNITKRAPDVPSELARIIDRCLEKNIHRRYQFAKGLATDLRNLAISIQKRKQRRIILSAVIVTLFVLLGVIGNSLRVERNAHRQSNASRLLALGQLQNKDPSASLAYAIASLDLADTQEARLFAWELLSRSPIGLFAKLENEPAALQFSRDGNWLAVSGRRGVTLLGKDGTLHIVTTYDSSVRGALEPPGIAPDGSFVLWKKKVEDKVLHIWSRKKRSDVRVLHYDGNTRIEVTDGGEVFLHTATQHGTVIRKWHFDGNNPEVVPSDVLIKARRKEKPPYRFEIQDQEGIGIYSDSDSEKPLHVFRMGEERAMDVVLASRSSLLAAANRTIRIWRLKAPLDSNPVQWPIVSNNRIVFDPPGKVLAVPVESGVAIFPIRREYPFVLQGEGFEGAENILFTPDGKWLASGFQAGSLSLWRLPGVAGSTRRDLWKPDSWIIRGTDMDPLGRFILAGSTGGFLVSLSDGSSKRLAGSPPDGNIIGVAFSPSGQIAAGIPGAWGPSADQMIRIWNLQSNGVEFLEGSKGKVYNALLFRSEDSLLSGDADGNVEKWDLQSKQSQSILRGKGAVLSMAVHRASKLLAVLFGSSTASQLTLLDLTTGTSRIIDSHGNRLSSIAIDQSGKIIATADATGLVRVGPISGETPHILYGLPSDANAVSIHPQNQWIAASGRNATVYLWPMPVGQPFHTLPYKQMIKELKLQTNLRVKPNENSSVYRVEWEKFSGW